MDREEEFTVASLTADLVVEILSRVSYKSFCGFKGACKDWLAFSSDPKYHKKLPRIPIGVFHGGECGSSIQLVILSPNDEEIDGTFTFVPHYKHLEFVDCCSGLVLFKYKSSYTSPDICRFIVCNPATRKWKALPDTCPEPYGPYGCQYKTILAFDPSWSEQFHVFNFQMDLYDGSLLGISKLEVFSSDLSTWFLDDAWYCTAPVNEPHLFIGGVLHVQSGDDQILVLKGLEGMSSGKQRHHFAIDLPTGCRSPIDSCFGQSSGFLQCAFAEESGRTVAIWNLDTYEPCKWSLKHRLSMEDSFGRDDLYLKSRQVFPNGYEVVALDLEKEVLLLVDKSAEKLLSFNFDTGKLSEIQDGCCSHDYYYYVASYSKLPGQAKV